MERFKNILVGVDLASADLVVAPDLSTATNRAIENAHWLAKQNDASLVFFSTLEVPQYMSYLDEEFADVEKSLIEEYERRLAALVQKAKQEGIAASHVLTVGKSWIEIIHQVLKHKHDLVVIGSRQRGPTASAILGSTGLKLLRKCPCPVWVCRPREDSDLGSILVADDLSEVSDLAVELGVSLANLRGSPLQVLHVLELGIGQPRWDSYSIRQRARAEAYKKMKEQLVRVEANRLQRPAQLEITVNDADTAILQEIEKRKIGLLVMATVARAGIAGVLTGNTAERLLPQIPCSVLAVKPRDFICPLSLD